MGKDSAPMIKSLLRICPISHSSAQNMKLNKVGGLWTIIAHFPGRSDLEKLVILLADITLQMARFVVTIIKDKKIMWCADQSTPDQRLQSGSLIICNLSLDCLILVLYNWTYF